MLRLFLISFALLFLTSCQTMKGGSYITLLPIENQTIARDATHQLSQLYPPAKTHFRITPYSDGFGLAFVNALRLKGYGINEGGITSHAQSSLTYVITSLSPYPLIRLTLKVDGKLISGVYTKNPKGEMNPLGTWIRQE